MAAAESAEVKVASAAVGAETLAKEGTHSEDGLNADQNQALSESFKNWSQPDAKRDSLWRSQVEGLFDMAESTRAEKVLDYLKPQIIFARYDADTQNQAYAQIWIERYLKLETRDFQKKQIQDLLLK